jgi:hypothetical protein
LPTIAELKELSTTQTPLFLFTFQLASDWTARYCTHRVEVDGEEYEARVLGHNLFDMRSDANEGIDSLARLSVNLANVDSVCSQIEQSPGWKGAKVTVRFLFFDLKNGVAASPSAVLFRGSANAPDEITETTLRVTATNRMNLQRLLTPEVRIQRLCPWRFPANAAQRAEAATGGTQGPSSAFYRCGYSPDVPGGCGSLAGGVPHTLCDYTRAQCQARGMFSQDAAASPTRRFGGIEFVPPSIQVRTYGEKSFHTSAVLENEGRYNDFVPMVYGTAWYAPPIVFARNDGNLTLMEVLLGMGEIEGVQKVLVNDIEIPAGRAGTNMTATGWFNIVGRGGRTGEFNRDFTDSNGNPLGDPYGSMAFLSLVVPNRINDGSSLPKVQVLIDGLKVARYGADGQPLDLAFDNNPAWVILDILRRCGWTMEGIDAASFAQTAAYCAGEIPAQDLYGNAIQIRRYQCNLVLRRRRSVADVIRGVRTACRVYLTPGTDGRLQLRAENSLALQQPDKAAGSNSTETLNDGWPCYEFGDGTSGFSGILRKDSGEPSLKFWSKSAADSSNRFSVEFQDAFNEYQQDSLSLVDVDDALLTGQEISATLNALGIPNFHQAARIIQLQLNKSIRGNKYAQFETSVRGVDLRPGDLITLTYLKEGYWRQAFRVQSVSPGLNHRTAVITAQIHDDEWYTDAASASGSGNRRQAGSGMGLPRPLLGSILNADGETDFEIQETADQTSEGQTSIRLKAGFVVPRQPSTSGPGIPLVDLSPAVSTTGGELKGDQTLYYALSAASADGGESPLSFLMRATIPPGTDSNAVQLKGLSFSSGTSGFSVYRGTNPVHLFLIATVQSVAATFLDTGLAIQLEAPPDANYDHANFYWRLELQPELAAEIHSVNTIGNPTLTMTANEYRGMVVRITAGKGRGEERKILSNDATTMTVGAAWETEPEASSTYVVAEAGWHFGALGRTSPVEFEAPNRPGATLHICGRAANVNDQECAYELSPVTRWRIGDSTGTAWDADRPGRPIFGLLPAGQGSVELTAVGFENLANTRTITSGMLGLYYWNELASPSQLLLSAEMSATDEAVNLSPGGGVQAGDLIQADAEIMAVTELLEGGSVGVVRGVHGSTAAVHLQATLIYRLSKRTYVLSFPKDFFGSPASGSYSHPIFLPDVRIASAELVGTNMRGSSDVSPASLTSTTDLGLRTLHGGQFSLQVEGYLAIQSDVTPPLVVEAAQSVRDVFAVLREPPTGAPVELELRLDAASYCRLTIPADGTMSNVVWGFGLPPLTAGAQINLDILSVAPGGTGTPGRDLTVTIRL